MPVYDRMRSLTKIRAIALILLMLAPMPAATLGQSGEPLADEATDFTDVTRQAGFPNDLGRTRIAWGDYDGDGWEDLLLDGRMLWRNRGDGTFQDVTSQTGIFGVNSHGGVWADYDNDGDLDFYANVRSDTHRDALWRNNGDGTFTEASAQAGEINDKLPTEGVAWGDYNGDGFVDLYVANYETASVDPDADLGIGTEDFLYHNNGDGTFTDVSGRAGIEVDTDRNGRGVVWADYDDDGDLDIYVSNYRLDPNFLWRNNGDGTFTNTARQARVEGYGVESSPGDVRFGHTIGSDFGDYDNDGDMDLYVSNLAHPRFIMFSDKSMLMKNQGDGTFIDRFYGSGIAYCETSSDSSWADFDNDGDLDLYYTAVYEDVGSRLFRNQGNERFEDATGETGTSVENGWGTGWCDYDHDGDLDLAVGSGSGMRLLENEGNGNHWFQVELEGTWANSKGIGARVRIDVDGDRQVRDVKAGRGTTSQDMFACHFGLGDNRGDVRVSVRWPGDRNWTDHGTFSADQRVHLVQGDVDIDASIALEVDPDAPRAGEAVDLTAFVDNEGDNTIDSVEVTFTVQGVGQVGQPHRLGPLGPGGSESAHTIWQPTREGVFTVSAELTDVVPFDTNPDNDVSTVAVTVRTTNMEPIARLNVEPSSGPPGMVFTLDGSNSSDDSAVAEYLFEYGDETETEWTASSIVTHEYSLEGEFLASLSVRDKEGLVSTNFATYMIRVSSMGFRPSAEILTIQPSPSREGQVVTLSGTGTAAAGATIERHSWNSSLDGHIGDGNLVTTTALSLGEHTIIYKVLDDRGLWSDPATTLLEVLPPEGDWTLTIQRPKEGADATGDTLEVAGKASYSVGFVVTVEVRLDNDPWEVATGTESWSHQLDIFDLPEGYHTIRVRASTLGSVSQTAMVNFTIGGVAPDEPFDLWVWIHTRDGIIVVMIMAAIVAVVVNIAIIRRRNRREARIRRPT
jgi:hypothetical protein